MATTITEQPLTPPHSAGSSIARMALLARRHAVFLAVLAGGAALRVAVHLAYPYPFGFPDSFTYAARAATWQPDHFRPFGYSLFLAPFVPGPLILVAIVQQVIGIGLVAAGYVLLIRREVRPWLAALAVVPVAAGDLELTLEQFIVSETLFTALLAGVLLILFWRRRVSVMAAAAVGLILAAVVLTRTVGQPIIVVVFGYLLVKLLVKQTSRWAPLAFLLAVTVPLIAYLSWFHHFYDSYSLERLSGRALYGRVMSIADCDRLQLTDRQRMLCPDPPPAHPEAVDWVWGRDSPASKYFRDIKEDPFLREFGFTVIRQQTGDYLFLVAKETSWHFLPKSPQSDLCWFGGWRLPARPNTACQASYFGSDADHTPQPATPLRAALARYSQVSATVRGPILALMLLVVLAAVAWRPRRGGGGRDSMDALLVAALGLGLLLASVAFGMYEPRYAVTSAFLMPLAGALALHRLGRAYSGTRHRQLE